MTLFTMLILSLVVIGSFIFTIFIEALLLYWGAGMAEIEDKTLWKSLAAVILCYLASAFLVVPLSIILPILGTGAGTIIGFFLSALIISGIFRTTFIKSVAAYVLAWLIGKVILVGLIFLGVTMLGVSAVLLNQAG